MNLENAEKGVYLIRCMINQLINHKIRDRKPPREMQRAFGSIWELINIEDTDGGDSDGEGDAQIVSISFPPQQPELVDLSGDRQEPPKPVQDPLQDSDPELQKLLTSEQDQDLQAVLRDEDPELQKLLAGDGDSAEDI
jgi:hypothetical protein